MRRLITLSALVSFMAFAATAFAEMITFEDIGAADGYQVQNVTKGGSGQPDISFFDYDMTTYDSSQSIYDSLYFPYDPTGFPGRPAYWELNSDGHVGYSIAYTDPVSHKTGPMGRDRTGETGTVINPGTKRLYGYNGFLLDGGFAMSAGRSLDPGAATGIMIDFVNNDGVGLTLKYSSKDRNGLFMDVYYTDGSVEKEGGPSVVYRMADDAIAFRDNRIGVLQNNNTGKKFIDYVLIHDNGSTQDWIIDDIGYSSVPEPSTIILFAGGLMFLLAYALYRRV